MNLEELKKTLDDGDRLVFTFGAYVFRKNGRTDFYEITASPAIRSKPPTGLFEVTNLYVDAGGHLIVEYDDTPT